MYFSATETEEPSSRLLTSDSNNYTVSHKMWMPRKKLEIEKFKTYTYVHGNVEDRNISLLGLIF